MSLEKINEYIKEEMKKKELKPEFLDIQKALFETFIIPKAQLSSLEEAKEAMTFAQVNTNEVDKKISELSSQKEKAREELITKFEKLVTRENKEELIKIFKKTKFIRRETLNYKMFKNLRPEVERMIKEVTNEEMVKLSPYKVAEIVRDEAMKYPVIQKFCELYQPETVGTDIDIWISKYAKTEEDIQQIKLHFTEISNSGFLTESMISNIAVRWSIMLGLSGNLGVDPESKKPLDQEMTNAVKEVSLIIRNNAVAVF